MFEWWNLFLHDAETFTVTLMFVLAVICIVVLLYSGGNEDERHR